MAMRRRRWVWVECRVGERHSKRRRRLRCRNLGVDPDEVVPTEVVVFVLVILNKTTPSLITEHLHFLLLICVFFSNELLIMTIIRFCRKR